MNKVLQYEMYICIVKFNKMLVNFQDKTDLNLVNIQNVHTELIKN